LNAPLATPAQPAGRRSTHPQLGREQLNWLLKAIVSSRPDEFTCGDCFDVADTFAELVLAGRNAAEALPRVHHHLDLCPPCREEFEALLDALRAISRSD
jgi:hypothetical protein